MGTDYIKTGMKIRNEMNQSYHDLTIEEYTKKLEEKWVSVEWLIDKGRELCFCPECFAVMGCYEHHCNECESRVANPWDAGIFIDWLEKQVKGR